jgi:hypothetical protein
MICTPNLNKLRLLLVSYVLNWFTAPAPLAFSLPSQVVRTAGASLMEELGETRNEN